VRTQLNRLVGGMRIFPAEITGTQAGGAPEDGRPDADHRGAITDPVRPPPIATHADDVHRLPAQVADEPAPMPGRGMGATIGLHLARRPRSGRAPSPPTSRSAPGASPPPNEHVT
jgi:hypothetical protein